MQRLALILAAIGVAVLFVSTAPSAVQPPPPTGPTAIALTGKVVLAWQPVTGADKYNVYRGTDPASITTLVSPGAGVTTTSFSDTSVTNGTTYYYVVRAVAATVESGNSLVVQVKPVGRSCSSGNATVIENCYPGNTTWQVINPSQVSAGGIEGYATAQSVNRGGSVNLKVNAADGTNFRIEVYRSGYYGGLGARLFSTILNVPAVSQPSCSNDAVTGLTDCSNWSVSATLTTTVDWPTGVYLLRLVRANGADAHILLVVRDDSSTSDALYGVSFTSFEAYNNYGGKSLYTFSSSGATTVSGTPRAVKVSFDRPFAQVQNGQRDWYPNDEFATVYWLEQSGYDVSYISNTDLETIPGTVLQHKLYISGSHDEYWSAGMRSALQSARDARVNLFFTGSNEIYWKVRFEASPTTGAAGRTLVCYKSTESGAADPSGIPTGTWRDPAGANLPENALAGQMYVGDNDEGYFPLVVNATQGADRVWRYTGLDTQIPGSSTSIGTNLVGWEWDARVANGFEPAGVKTLSASPVSGELIQGNGHNTLPGSTTVSMTKYTAPSGALVVSTGTNQWNWGLAKSAGGLGEPNTVIQQATTNILEDMGAVPQTPAANITLDNPQTNRPPAPTGVTTAVLGSDSIRVSWSPVANATGYSVYRALAPRQGGQPLGFLANPQAITGTTFTDTGLASSTNYFYVVTAVVAGVQSLASNEAQAITAAAAGQATRINAGGPDYTASTGATYRADALFTGGSVNATTKAISGTNDPQLYQDERWGQFSYSIPVANGVYDVRFHFAELFYSAPCTGKRVFGMDILDTTVSPDLANIDICKAVGPAAAYDLTVSRVSVTDGALDIRSVYGSADDPEVTAIEVIPDQVAPSVVSTTPASAAQDVPVSSTVSASFSEGMNASTITASTFTLTAPGNVSVPATVAYNASTETATLTPTHALAFGTVYTAHIASTVAASDGTPLGTAFTWSFTSHQPHAPGVTSTFPSGSPTGISPQLSVTATFDQALDPTTVTSSSFTLATSGGTSVPATVSYDNSTFTATLKPQQPLALATTYVATLSPAITSATDGVSLSGAVSWSFTTAATSPAAPTVVSTPAAGATGVALAPTVQAAFSRSMLASTISGSTFTLAGPAGPVAATVTFNAATSTATLTPSAALSPSTTYTATLAAGIAASDGTPLGTAVTWSFATVAGPTMTASSPAAGATFVPRNTTATATFSRAMDPTTLTGASFTMTPAGGSSVPASVSYDGVSRTATLTPSSLLASGTTYTVTIDTTVKAADGANLVQPYSWSFTTAACPCTLFPDVLQPAVVDVPTVDGRTGTGPFTYELGTKITVDQPMQLTAFRFFKSPSETGTHTGKLWTAGGVLLAQQSFTNETASGWQQQPLASPVTLQPGVVYTVSVNANAFFVSTLGGLATQIVSGPMRSVADGANGQYGLSAGTFPNQTYSSSNYFVDAVVDTPGTPGPLGVLTTTPAANATGVSRTAGITAQFSRSADATTVTASTFTVTGPGGPVAGTVTYDATSQTATFTPSSALAFSTVYTAQLTSGILAADGMPLTATQWSFTTADPVRPQVVRTVPAAGATDATTSATVKAVFSKDMDPTLLSPSTFTLTGPSGAVGGTVTYDSPTLTATFTPSAALTAGATYTAKLSAVVAATDGASLGSAYSWSFTVASATLPPPTVVSTSPASGATLVSRNPSVTATLSRSLDPTTVTSSTVTLATSTGTAVPSTVSYNDATKTITLTPNATLAGSTTYTATIGAGVQAIDGTALGTAYTWSFATAACPCSLFSNVMQPASTSLSVSDGRSGTGLTYEMGVKVTVDQPTQVNAVRFFKSPGETGVHIGRVWTSAGVQLGQVTFAGETASGWQVQNLSTPITLQPGSTYVVSVNMNSFFVMTANGLATSVLSGPLHTVVGANGVFGNSAGTFPTQSFSSSNYFIDVVADLAGAAAPPTVSGQTPANGTTGVAPSTSVSATFSRSMDASTLTGTTVTLSGPSGSIPATVAYNGTTNVITLTPNASLAFGAVYTARLDASIRAADGTALGSPVSWSFTTAAAVPPQVTSTVPTNGATGINPAVVIRADFSKALNAATVNSSTFTLSGPSGAVAGTVAYNASLQEATLTPAAQLPAGSYTATLAASIAATDGVQLGTPTTWSFTVASTPAPLTVAPGSPAAGATGVGRDTTVTAVFSRDVTASTITTTSFVLLAPGGAAVPATVAYNASTHVATLTPSSTLTASTTYTVQLANTIHSDDSTVLSGTTSWTFTTSACPCSVFSTTLAPVSINNPTQDGRSGTGPFSYELGMKFTVDSSAQLTAIQFYKDPKETGTHVGTLWTSTGTQLATVTFTNESASGWQTQALATPVQLQPGTTYVVSVNANAFFVATVSGLATSQGTGPLHSVVGSNGVFGAAAGVFPTSSFSSSNYFVDVTVR